MPEPVTANVTPSASITSDKSPTSKKPGWFSRVISSESDAERSLLSNHPLTTGVIAGTGAALIAPPIARGIGAGVDALKGAFSRGAHEKVSEEVGGEAAKGFLGSLVSSVTNRYK